MRVGEPDTGHQSAPLWEDQVKKKEREGQELDLAELPLVHVSLFCGFVMVLTISYCTFFIMFSLFPFFFDRDRK